MTAAFHHGKPGSFKSFAVVQDVMVKEILKGRTVVTNIRGFNSIPKIQEVLAEDIPNNSKIEDSKIIYVEADTNEGYEYLARFFHWAPLGALIVLDEAQRIYSKKERSFSKYNYKNPEGTPPKEARPETLENAFDQHRHYDWDIYLLTPNIQKVHSEIRQVADIAYRHRSLKGMLPDWWPSWMPFLKKIDWRQYAHDPEHTGLSTTHYLETPTDHRVDSRIFELYQSTKTNKKKEKLEERKIFKDRRIRMALLVIGISLFAFIWQVITILTRDSQTSLEIVESGLEDSGAGLNNDLGYASPGDLPQAMVSQNFYVGFLSGYSLFITGQYDNKILLEARKGELIYYLDSETLNRMGYEITLYSRCFGEIQKSRVSQEIACLPSNKSEQAQLPQETPTIQPVIQTPQTVINPFQET